MVERCQSNSYYALPTAFVEAVKYVRNIIDKGKDTAERDSRFLDSLLEESTKRAFEAAKSLQPPSGKKHNPYRAETAADPTAGKDKPDQELDETDDQWFHKNTNGTLTWAE